MAEKHAPAGFEPAPCGFMLAPAQVEGETVRCGSIAVPERHARPDGPWIRLAVAIFGSPGEAKDPVVLLPGGPGLRLAQLGKPLTRERVAALAPAPQPPWLRPRLAARAGGSPPGILKTIPAMLHGVREGRPGLLGNAIGASPMLTSFMRLSYGMHLSTLCREDVSATSPEAVSASAAGAPRLLPAHAVRHVQHLRAVALGRGQHVVIAGGAHAVLDTGTCAADLAQEFLRKPTVRPDTSCAAASRVEFLVEAP
ncbi:hypothetical protein ACQKGO_10235 [Corallococcus interemptor]|uniref:hypothetical protein n=1 Tax=Corallococcus interemptor TaxID=2316720 RepID=UPI003CFE72E0